MSKINLKSEEFREFYKKINTWKEEPICHPNASPIYQHDIDSFYKLISEKEKLHQKLYEEAIDKATDNACNTP